MHQNKEKVRKFPWKCVLRTAVKLTIFSNIQLIKKEFSRNIDGHMTEQSWNNEACRLIISKIIIKNLLWKNKWPYFSEKRVCKNLEIFMRNLTHSLKPSYWRLAGSFNFACWYEVGSEFLPKHWSAGKHRFGRSRKRLIHDVTVSTAHVQNINGR